MAYIVAVNPSIMANEGMDRGDRAVATVLTAVFGTVMMGLWANLPFAVAPAMASNMIFAFVIVKQMGALGRLHRHGAPRPLPVEAAPEGGKRRARGA